VASAATASIARFLIVFIILIIFYDDYYWKIKTGFIRDYPI